ncbi:hypothetical protein ACLBW8_28485, partial [Pseudomonas sp. M5A4_2d]
LTRYTSLGRISGKSRYVKKTQRLQGAFFLVPLGRYDKSLGFIIAAVVWCKTKLWLKSPQIGGLFCGEESWWTAGTNVECASDPTMANQTGFRRKTTQSTVEQKA